MIAALVSGIIKIAAMLSQDFAAFFNRYISAVFRAIFAHITSLIPFSIAETLIICAIPLAIVFFLYSIKVSAKRGRLTRQIFRVIAVICFIFSTFVLNYGTGYDAPSMRERLGEEIAPPTADELYSASAMTAIKLYELEDDLYLSKSGSTVMPYSFSELTEKLNVAYDVLYEEYDFLSPLHTGVKQIALSRPLTYTHMSGFYTFFTGEANVNTNYPDFVVAFTTAHEMAHQRGVAREDEANFVAFLACLAADDDYLNYCAYANIFEYLANAFHEADPERYSELIGFLPDAVKSEYTAYGNMFAPYSDSVAADVSSAINDTYLKTQGVDEGTKSYGLVVDFAAAYMNKMLEGELK